MRREARKHASGGLGLQISALRAVIGDVLWQLHTTESSDPEWFAVSPSARPGLQRPRPETLQRKII